MPSIPPEAHTIHGGCNCKAIRYEVSFPEYSKRPIQHSAADCKGQGEIRQPLAVFCHCNNCRSATGAIAQTWLLTPIEYAKFHLVKKGDEDGERVERPATEAFRPGPETEGTFLSHYQSSKAVTRTFCSRCGTNITYEVHPTPEGMRTTLDVVLGTVDREYLENVRPDRHYFCDFAIDWVQKLLVEGDRSLRESGEEALARHPTYKTDEFMGRL